MRINNNPVFPRFKPDGKMLGSFEFIISKILRDGEIAYSTLTERPYTALLPSVGTKVCITLTKESNQILLKGKPIDAVESIKTVNVFSQ